MSLSRRTWLALGCAVALAACGGDHYEGGGRRNELPQGSGTKTPNIGPGDATSTNGGTSTDDGAAGAASTPVAAAGAP